MTDENSTRKESYFSRVRGYGIFPDGSLQFHREDDKWETVNEKDFLELIRIASRLSWIPLTSRLKPETINDLTHLLD